MRIGKSLAFGILMGVADELGRTVVQYAASRLLGNEPDEDEEDDDEEDTDE